MHLASSSLIDLQISFPFLFPFPRYRDTRSSQHHISNTSHTPGPLLSLPNFFFQFPPLLQYKTQPLPFPFPPKPLSSPRSTPRRLEKRKIQHLRPHIHLTLLLKMNFLKYVSSFPFYLLLPPLYSVISSLDLPPFIYQTNINDIFVSKE